MRWKSWIKITLTCLGQNQSNMNSIVYYTELLLSSCLYNLYSRKTHLEELDSTLTINFDTINSSIILCIWITDKIILIWCALGPLYSITWTWLSKLTSELSNNAIYRTSGRIYYVITPWNKQSNSLSKIIFFESF